MKDGGKTEKKLRKELKTLKSRLAKLEKTEAKRKQAEGALKESEERYRNIIENANDMIQSVRPDGHFEYVNRAWMETLGYTETKLPSLTIFDIIHSDSLAHCQELFQRVMAGEALAGIQATFVTRDGRQVFVEGNVTPRYLKGKMIASHGFFRDITERKQAEKALKESEELLATAQEIASIGSWDWDIKNNVLKWSDQTYRNHGLEPGEATPTYELFEEHVHPDDIEGVNKAVEHSLETGEPYDIDIRRVIKNGEERIFRALGRVVKNGEGEIVRFIGTEQDVTERKEAEEELQKSAVYLDTMPDVLCVTDSGGKIVRVNQTFYDLWGYSPDEVMGKSALLMFSEGERKKLKKEVKTAIKTGAPRHFETSILTKHGEEIPVSLSETALKDEKGKVTAIITVLKDITLHKKAEGALRQAYDEIKSINELKSDIIANVTHELRTPITIIRGVIEMTLDEKNPAERRTLLKMALDALTRQNTIIADLIEATKIKEKRKHEIGPIYLNDVVPLVSSEFKALLIKNKLELKIDLDKNLPLVMADFEGLSHVFRNLINNAIKFNKVGGTVTITAVEKEGFVEVCVIDAGIGMPEDVRDKVFDRFYQADSSPGREYGGIGLGLTIVKEIVEVHGGGIRVKSRAGKGSAFCFTLMSALPDA